jgi:hypothetical protein
VRVRVRVRVREAHLQVKSLPAVKIGHLKNAQHCLDTVVPANIVDKLQILFVSSVAIVCVSGGEQ